MSKFSVVCISAMSVCAAALGLASSHAADKTAIPDFSSNNAGWTSIGGDNEFTPPKSGIGPVKDDPAHPYVSNFRARRTGEQPNWRVADIDNPNLKPWVVDALRKANVDALSGKAMFTREARCWPTGVPAMLLNPGSIFFIQTPKQVVLIQESDHRVRHIYLNVPHSKNPAASWYGESVGHYENGDTLVVDTVGQNDKTFVDSYRTPHTDKIHVVERFKIVNGGKGLEASFTVDDPGAFNQPWSGIKPYQRADGPLVEDACAENNDSYFGYDVEPLPQAAKPDF